MLLTILHYISGPVIGAVIGAFTNYIAIKMLFRPLKPVKIGKFTLPFTPGVIPRHQEALAEALSNTVYQNFFTNTDIEGIFMSEEMTERFSEGIYNMASQTKIADLSENVSEESKLKIKEAVYHKMHAAIVRTDIEGLVAGEAEKIIREKVKGKLVTNLILNEDIAGRLSHYVGRQVEDYVVKNDLELLYPILTEQSDELKDKDLGTILSDVGVEKQVVMDAIRKGYVRFMSGAKEKIAETFHIKQFIYDKIMELDPGEIERLVNEAIKREMNYLVYLGGLLGLIIGILNIFI